MLLLCNERRENKISLFVCGKRKCLHGGVFEVMLFWHYGILFSKWSHLFIFFLVLLASVFLSSVLHEE